MGLGKNFDDRHRETVRYLEACLPGFPFDEITWTSDPTPQWGAQIPYNCMGLAMESLGWWQPPTIPGDPEGDPRHFWPIAVDAQDISFPPRVKLYVAAAEAQSFTDCGQNPEWEEGFEKIVLIHDGGLFNHAALRISPDRWKSKQGDLSDFEHPLRSIIGGCHGTETIFMKREWRSRA